MHFYHATPIFQAHRLNTQLNFQVSYKMECFQPSGSFKIRGMETILKDLAQKGFREVLCSSGGNAGYSLAYVGQQMGIAVKIIVPKTTSAYMIDKIKNLDAEVEIHGESWNEAHVHASALSESLHIPYVPPFDHPLLWQGHSSLIDECAKVMPAPNRIVVAVGGGGLLCGVFEGMLRNHWLHTKVVTAETEGAASFAKSMATGTLIELPTIDTIATSLGAKRVAAKALEYAAKFEVETYVTDDKTAFTACADFFNDQHMLVEPACGAALSYPLVKQDAIKAGERVLVIACGGVNMGLDAFNTYTKKYAG